MAGHTSEPWIVGIDHRGETVVRDACRCAILTSTHWGVKETAGNAARAVACVNALAGIADPSAVGELVEVTSAMLEGLWGDDDPELTPLKKKARSLLSRLKGGES